MKSKKCYHCVLRLNRYEKQYLRMHIQKVHRLYDKSMKLLAKEKEHHHPMRSTSQMRGLLKEYFRYDLEKMDEKEIQHIVHQLMQYQTTDKEVYFDGCYIFDKTLTWRNFSLISHIKRNITLNTCLYAKIYEHHRRIYVDVFYMKSSRK